MKKQKEQYFINLLPNTNVVTYQTTKECSLDWLISDGPLKNKTIIEMTQEHSADFCFIDAISNIKKREVVAGVDGLFTRQKEVALVVRTADCLPVLIYHPELLIVAIHAGRKGTEEGVVRNTLKEIKKRFGFEEGFYFWFGPAICKECYQVDRSNNLHYDLLAENLKQIKSEIDINQSKIYYADLCTACNTDLFFSYRKEGSRAGRMHSIILMK
jgi:polyphenol oxidase